MAGFLGVKDIVDAELAGRSRISTFRKLPTQVTTIGVWFDLSMSPGNPNPQYYIASPAVGTPMSRSTQGGIFYGDDVSPSSKYVANVTLMTPVATALPMTMILQDYLYFYSFLDESLDGEEQLLDNTDPMTRYVDGAGVMIMPIVVAGHATGGTGISLSCSYTNQDGVAGRSTVSAVLTPNQFVNGTVLTSSRIFVGCTGPYLTLQQGDTGVRSIQSVTMTGADVGLFALVLVKPLLTTQIRGVDAPVECEPLLRQGLTLPEIKDDAYLNFVCLPSGSLSATRIDGYIKTIWT